MKKNKFLKKLSAAVLTAALATGLMATSVSAAPDPAIEGSITVHKLATMGESSNYHNGKEIEDTTMYGSPLADAGFTLYKVNSNADLDAVIAAAADPTSQAYSNAITALKSSATVVGSEQFTNSDGETVFDNLTAGYYILEETTTPEGYAAAKLSMITFPYGYNPDESNDGVTTEYNYDVHVYPKNVSSKEVTKVVKDKKDAYVVGDVVTWEIGARLDGAKEISTLVVTDPLDERLDYTVGDTTVTLTGGSDSAVLVSGTDYTETFVNNVLTITLTGGRAKALALGSTGIIVNIPTTINEKAQGSTGPSISNGGTVDIKYTDGSDGGGEIDEEEKPSIDLGGIIIDKTNYAGDQKLANAKFKLALNSADAQNGVFLKDEDGNDIEVITDENGYAHFVDFRQASPAVNWGNVNQFYLVETQAPAGYLLKQSAVQVVTSDDGTTSGTPQKQTSVTVKNQTKEDPPIEGENPTFQLPLTGGMGTVLFTVIGAILMIGAAVILVKSRKKNA